MAFLDNAVMLDAARLTQQAKATVQNNGRLGFSTEAERILGLSDKGSIIIFSVGERDLGAVVMEKGDARAFPLKKSGPYFYIHFRNYLLENGIDYKGVRVVYDIMRLNEQFEGHPVFKFERRDIPHIVGTQDEAPTESGQED